MITLRTFDLYANGYIEEFADGEKYLERDEIVYSGEDSDRFHTVKETDTLTRIAYKYYKDIMQTPQQYWHIIADANDIVNPLDLAEYIGQDLIIPDPVLFQIKLING